MPETPSTTAAPTAASRTPGGDVASGGGGMTVPLIDLRAQYAPLRDEVMAAVAEVFDAQAMINGPAVAKFEAAVAVYSTSGHAIGVSSGSDALICALMALDIGPGDEVITSPFTFFASAGAVARLGATPVFVDIEPATFNLDPAKLAAAVTPKTKAIMPVHLFGQCADMDAINAVARERGLSVVEDAAQSIGATYKGRHAGSMGTVGCFSFFPTKNLGGAGDGGMIVTQDAELADRMRALRNHGSHVRYYHQWVGGNFRLDTVQAAYLMVKLPHLDGWSAKRRRNAAVYDELLAGVDTVTTPTIAPGNVSIYNQYVIRAERRDALREHLKSRSIGTEVYYPLSLHEQECFKGLGYARGDFPESERAAAEVVALPIFPELSTEQVRYVAAEIRRFYGG